MDELIDVVAGSLEISTEPNKTSTSHPRFSQFKSKSSKQDQNSRRAQILDIQKKSRFDFTNHIRKLAEDDWGDDEQLEEGGDSDGMDVEIKKPGCHYKEQLMMSEWLVEVPADFEENWVTVLCPVGRRTLVITNGYSTKAYSRSGHFLRSFPSALPGGKRQKSRSNSSCKKSTVLDCLYNDVDQIYFVLDLMCWNGHSIYDTETDFRFYWLKERLDEVPAVCEKSSINPFRFLLLPRFPCMPASIGESVATANFEIDGLLFYHKHTHYLFGSSPLVVWLKPYMLPEILGISVPDKQMSHLPAGYTNYTDHMKSVGENRSRDTNMTRRDYKAYGLQKSCHQPRDLEMREASQEDGGGSKPDYGTI